MVASDIKNISAEAGVIASILLKPELVYFSEHLKPNHFSDPANAYIYYAVSSLVDQQVEKVDEYNIINYLNMKRGTSHVSDDLQRVISIQSLQDLFRNAGLIARREPADYKILVKGVLDAAFRRNTFTKLCECEKICADGESEDIERKIYSTLDSVMMEFSASADLSEYKDIVDDCWAEIKARQQGKTQAIEFPFRALNEYVVMEPGELICFTAPAKMGKSAMLLTCTVDLLRKDKSVLVIDSEISTKLYTMRLLCHLSGIKFSDLRSGSYTKQDERKIDEAIAWLKTRRFIHVYMPIFDEDAVYLAAKKAKHLINIDCIVVDYLKSTSEKDEAFATYNQMGRFSDMLKNKICGDMKLCGLTAAQATTSGKIADSAKIGRNVSTVISIMDKTPEETERDGYDCGNKKIRVVFNRNGAQMSENEYIDMNFDGSHVIYTQAAQHSAAEPF